MLATILGMYFFNLLLINLHENVSFVGHCQLGLDCGSK